MSLRTSSVRIAVKATPQGITLTKNPRISVESFGDRSLILHLPHLNSRGKAIITPSLEFRVSEMQELFSDPTRSNDRKEIMERGLTYEEADAFRFIDVKKVPNGFWSNEVTARNIILATLDSIDGFKPARDSINIKTMADLYRKEVMKYKSVKGKQGGMVS